MGLSEGRKNSRCNSVTFQGASLTFLSFACVGAVKPAYFSPQWEGVRGAGAHSLYHLYKMQILTANMLWCPFLMQIATIFHLFKPYPCTSEHKHVKAEQFFPMIVFFLSRLAEKSQWAQSARSSTACLHYRMLSTGTNKNDTSDSGYG